MSTTSITLQEVIEAGEDFEWYPTTDRMIEAVAKRIGGTPGSLMDIGAGDGRVLKSLWKWQDRGDEKHRDLYAIERSSVLAQQWPEYITPVGTDFFEQNLACLQVDFIFCNPPYSQFETWASTIIEAGYARKAFLVIPRRWKEAKSIQAALKKRNATATVIHSDDFNDAERRARAVVDIVEVTYPKKHDYYSAEAEDPFDIWFDQNIDAFDKEKEVAEDVNTARDLLKGHADTIGGLVEAFNEEYARMEENYRAIFKLDYAILKELQVSKDGVREGIKKRMAGLKAKYWELLFNRLDTITSRLATETKERFLKKLTGRAAIAFTASNCYAVVLWAIKHANKYYDEQVIKLFRGLSAFEGVMNYKSNQRTWQRDGWRFLNDPHRDSTEKPSHYVLDYRIVIRRYSAIAGEDSYSRWESPGGLHKNCHELIDDVIAVIGNLGFSAPTETPSRNRHWTSNDWQDWQMNDGSTLFQAKAFKNGNLHFRFKPDAIRALNVEAGRLLGWLRSPADAVAELGYSAEEASKFFGANRQLTPTSVKLLNAAAAEAAA